MSYPRFATFLYEKISMTKITTPDWDKNSWLCSVDYINYTVKLLSDCLNMKPSSKILDIGCGRGTITKALAEFNHVTSPVEGIDVSETIFDAVSTDQVQFFYSDACQYLRDKCENIYDGVVIKQAFHLIDGENRKLLVSKLRHCIKKKGRALIFQMPYQSCVPMFSKGKDIFKREVFPISGVIGLADEYGFKTQRTDFSFTVHISKRNYFQLLKRRYISSIRDFSDQEIEEGILELDGIFPQDQLEFEDKLDVVHLINS